MSMLDGPENTQKVETVEIVETVDVVEEVQWVEEPEESDDISELEEEFRIFSEDVEKASMRITTDVQMDELNEIGDSIIQAKEYLMSFAKGESKTFREKAYNQLSAIPMLGNYAKKKVEQVKVQALKDSGVKEVLTGIFDKFEAKKKRLIDLTDTADNIRNQLSAQNIQLSLYIKKLDRIIQTTHKPSTKLRALDMSIQAQSQEKIIQDQIHNKLEFIINLMETLHTRMSKTLPSLKSQLLNETSIAGMIGNIADSVKMMNTLQDLTNEISITSTQNIQGLIVDVTNQLTRTSDIDYLKKYQEINTKHQESMMIARENYIKSTVTNYNTLKNISGDLSHQLEHRVQKESEVLELVLPSSPGSKR